MAQFHIVQANHTALTGSRIVADTQLGGRPIGAGKGQALSTGGPGIDRKIGRDVAVEVLVPDLKGHVYARGIAHGQADLVVKLQVPRRQIAYKKVGLAPQTRAVVAERTAPVAGSVPAGAVGSEPAPTVCSAREAGHHGMVAWVRNLTGQAASTAGSRATGIVEQIIDRVLEHRTHVDAPSAGPVVDRADVPPIDHATRAIGRFEIPRRTVPNHANPLAGLPGDMGKDFARTGSHDGTRIESGDRVESVEVAFQAVGVASAGNGRHTGSSQFEGCVVDQARGGHLIDHLHHGFHATDKAVRPVHAVVPVVVAQNEEPTPGSQVGGIGVHVRLDDGIAAHIVAATGAGQTRTPVVVFVVEAQIKDDAVIAGGQGQGGIGGDIAGTAGPSLAGVVGLGHLNLLDGEIEAGPGIAPRAGQQAEQTGRAVNDKRIKGDIVVVDDKDPAAARDRFTRARVSMQKRTRPSKSQMRKKNKECNF